MTNDLNRKKKIQFRCWHRGTREMDLILGRYIDSLYDSLSLTDIGFFETLLSYSDDKIYKWVTKRETAIPDDLQHPLFDKLLQFYDVKS